MEPYKDSCDHCGTMVDRRWWTFDMRQCVVCSDPVCKEKQQVILRDAMQKAVNDMFNQMVNESATQPDKGETKE